MARKINNVELFLEGIKSLVITFLVSSFVFVLGILFSGSGHV